MKQLRYLLIFVLIIFFSNSYGQLNKFMVQWSFYDQTNYPSDKIIKTVPWREWSDVNNRYLENTVKYKAYLEKMSSTYHFNTVTFYNHETQGKSPYNQSQDPQDFLKLAKECGLSSIINNPSICVHELNYSNWDKDMKDAMDSYANLGVIGYYGLDEPAAINFPLVSQVHSEMKKNDPVMLRWTNLYPSFVSNFNYHSLDSPSEIARLNLDYISGYEDQHFREEYIQKYVNTCNPNILTFDEYPILDKSVSFFRSLYDYGLKSVENSIPLCYLLSPIKNSCNNSSAVKSLNDLTVCLDGNNNFPAKSIPEFNYVIFSSLAYGGKGIVYWSGFDWQAIMDETNSFYSPFPLYYDNNTANFIINLHEKLTKLENSKLLLSLNFVSAYHTSKKSTIVPNSFEKIQYWQEWDGRSVNFASCGIANDEYAKFIFANPLEPIKADIVTDNSIATQNYNNNNQLVKDLAYTFLTDRDKNIYFWILNKNIESTQSHLLLKLNKANIESVVDILTEKAYNYQDDITIDDIKPGEGKLFKVNKVNNSNIVTVNIENKIYETLVNMPLNLDEVVYENKNPNSYPFVSADKILFADKAITGTGQVTFESGSWSSFMAHNIVLGKGVRMKLGSHVRLKKYTDSNIINTIQTQGIKRFEPNNESAELEKIAIDREIKVFPNPTKSDFKVSMNLTENENAEIKVFDNMGRLVKTLEANSTVTNVSLGNESAGVYLVRFTTKDKSYNYKIIKL